MNESLSRFLSLKETASRPGGQLHCPFLAKHLTTGSVRLSIVIKTTSIISIVARPRMLLSDLIQKTLTGCVHTHTHTHTHPVHACTQTKRTHTHTHTCTHTYAWTQRDTHNYAIIRKKFYTSVSYAKCWSPCILFYSHSLPNHSFFCYCNVLYRCSCVCF